MRMDTIARVDGLISLKWPTPGDDVIQDLGVFLKLLPQTAETCTLMILPAGSRCWRCSRLHHLRHRGLQASRRAGDEEGVQTLRDPVEARQNLFDPGFGPNSDPTLEREQVKYVGFIELLRSRNLVRFGTWR